MSRELQQAIKQISSTPDEIYSVLAEVIEIDATANTCDLRPIDGSADIFNVRLQAEEDLTEGILILPQKGNTVIATFLDRNRAYIALCSKIEKAQIKIDTSEITVEKDNITLKQGNVEIGLKAGKVTIKNASVDLGNLLSELITAISALTVTCTAPGSLSSPPANIAQFQTISTKLKTLL